MTWDTSCGLIDGFRAFCFCFWLLHGFSFASFFTLILTDWKHARPHEVRSIWPKLIANSFTRNGISTAWENATPALADEGDTHSVPLVLAFILRYPYTLLLHGRYTWERECGDLSVADLLSAWGLRIHVSLASDYRQTCVTLCDTAVRSTLVLISLTIPRV